MVNTYTSGWQTVDRGDVTTHNPQSSVSTSDEISVVSAEVQWEGINGSKQTKTEDSSSPWGPYTTSKSPSATSPYTFENHDDDPNITGDEVETKIELTITNTGNHDRSFEAFYDHNNSGSWTEFTETDFTPTILSPNESITMGQTETRSIGGTYYHPPDVEFKINQGSANDAPNENVPMDIEASVTYTSYEYTTTTTYTTDPRVTRDVTGESGGITLDDGEQSQWYTLSGLTADDEEFYHSIDGSKTARFRFRFDWETVYPTPSHGMVGFYDSSADAWHEVIVATPTDANLQHNHITIYNASEDSWGALDVVDVSNDLALEQYAFYDSDAGWLAPRKYQTQ